MNRIIIVLFCLMSFLIEAQETFQPLDVYDLEFASDPQFSPDGKQIIFLRHFMDVMTDKRLSNLWFSDVQGARQRPLTNGNYNHRSPVWSPDGTKLIYLSNESGKTQIHLLYLDVGQSSKLTNVQSAPSSISWSPDGQWIAFTMRQEKEQAPIVKMPQKPKGATWQDPPKYIDKLVYRSDGSGYISESYNHVFVIPVSGGTARQITSGDFNHSSPTWSKDGRSIFFSANRSADWEYDQRNSELFQIDIYSKTITQLTDRYGPDQSPVLSPDGQQIAYLGYDDKKLGYQHARLYTMNTDGSNIKCLSERVDHDISNIQWADDQRGIYVQYNKHGNSKVGIISKDGTLLNLANNLGGTSIGRPYSGGDYDVHDDQIVYMETTPTQPSELVISNPKRKYIKQITNFNKDVLAFKKLGQVEEIWYKSSYDGADIQGWIMTPPDFDPSKKYPLILEIHGGPFTNYGDRFSPELQLMASLGNVILYTNPRGSTSYGEDFSNLIHHNYPSNDYDDLMSGVDAVINKGYIDEDRLFITGGSGGGVLTSWTIGKTDRFAAAVVAKPVINWYSWALTADISGVVHYWFPGMPWDHQEHYMKRSPISLVGNVKTPTMLLTGEEDYRTPMSESEQYYQALKLRKVPSALVRIQGASHGIAAKPSNLLAKVAYITGWFNEFDLKELKP